MKKTNLLLSVICVLSLSACQAGKVSSQSFSSKNQAASGNSVNTAVIDLGNLTNGNVLDVKSNPTPTPGPSIAPLDNQNFSNVEIKREVTFAMFKLLSYISTDAQAATIAQPPVSQPIIVAPSLNPDSFQFYSNADLLGKLQSVVGLGQLEAYQNQYNYYVAATASNATQALSADLQKPTTLTFTSANGKVSSLTVPLVTLLAPHTSVITYGVKAYIGVGLIPSATTAVAAVPLANLSYPDFIKIGASTIIVIGGKNGTVFNRNIARITLSASNTFAITSSPTSLSTSASLANVVSKAVDSTLATAAGVTGSYIGNYALIANLNSSNKITGYSFLKYSSGVITSYTGTCASLVSHFSGYVCNSTSTSTLTSTEVLLNN